MAAVLTVPTYCYIPLVRIYLFNIQHCVKFCLQGHTNERVQLEFVDFELHYTDGPPSTATK